MKTRLTGRGHTEITYSILRVISALMGTEIRADVGVILFMYQKKEQASSLLGTVLTSRLLPKYLL